MYTNSKAFIERRKISREEALRVADKESNGKIGFILGGKGNLYKDISKEEDKKEEDTGFFSKIKKKLLDK